MKCRILLGALLLPTVVTAQQPSIKPLTGQATTLPYCVPGIQENSQPYAFILPLPAGVQYIPATSLDSTPPRSNVRVNLNLRNAPLKEAVKQLSEQTKQEFVLEADAPTDAKITLVAKNIRLSTALDMLTDATELNWNQQTVKKAGSQESSLVFHLGKKIARSLYGGSTTFPNNNVRYFNSPAIQWNRNPNELKLNYQYKLQDNKLNLLQSKPLSSLYTQANQNLLSFSQRSSATVSKPLSNLYTLGSSLLGTTNLLETRSTFTCPNCKHQVTVLHQHQAPKCDKCGRAFHDDWEFCPIDGAKRPTNANDDWQFCPICGKSIKPEEKSGKTESKPTK